MLDFKHLRGYTVLLLSRALFASLMSELVVGVRVDDVWFKVGVLVGKILRSTINFAECDEMEGLKWTAYQCMCVSLDHVVEEVVIAVSR